MLVGQVTEVCHDTQMSRVSPHMSPMTHVSRRLLMRDSCDSSDSYYSFESQFRHPSGWAIKTTNMSLVSQMNHTVLMSLTTRMSHIFIKEPGLVSVCFIGASLFAFHCHKSVSVQSGSGLYTPLLFCQKRRGTSQESVKLDTEITLNE